MATRQEREQANRVYLKDKVDVHLNKLIMEILKAKPDNVLEFIHNWAKKACEGSSEAKPTQEAKKEEAPVEAPKKDEKYVAPDIESEDDEDGDEVPDMDAFLQKNKKDTNTRISVSAEAYGEFNKKADFTPPVHEKPEDTIAKIKEKLENCFMFKALQPKEKSVVIGAMQEVKFAKDDKVISQGDDGDVLYIVDTGKLACYRKPSKDAEDVFLKDYSAGELFGELALLYNAPRAATIIASEDTTCFTLDRQTFDHIVKSATMKRREQFENFVSKVELLKGLDSYDRGQIADVLETAHYKDGDKVIEQGETGDKFYFIETGTAKAMKKCSESGEEKEVMEYKENMYFGEIALLKDDVRQATIIATSDLKVAYLDRSAFNRLLGPLNAMLTEGIDHYKTGLE